MMLKEKYRRYVNWGVTIFLIISCSLLVFFAIWRFDEVVKGWHTLMDIIAPIVTGLVIAYLLGPVAGWCVKQFNRIPGKNGKWRKRITRGAAIVLAEILMLAIISFVVGTLLPQILETLRSLVYNIDGYIAAAERLIEPLLELNPTVRTTFETLITQAETSLKGFFTNDVMKLMGTLTSGILGVGRFIYNFVIGVIVSIYLMAGTDVLVGRSKKLLYAFVRSDLADQTLDVARQTNRMFHGFIVGKILDSTIIGVLCFLGMTALGLPYPLLISVIVGITNVIPYFGPFLGAIPSALLILLIDPTKCLIFVLFILALQQLDGNYIGPKVLGNTTGLSSLGVLFSILIGGGLFGIVGMIVSVPICGVMYSLIKRLTDRKLKKRGMPTDTALYVDAVDPASMVEQPISED